MLQLENWGLWLWTQLEEEDRTMIPACGGGGLALAIFFLCLVEKFVTVFLEKHSQGPVENIAGATLKLGISRMNYMQVYRIKFKFYGPVV